MDCITYICLSISNFSRINCVVSVHSVYRRAKIEHFSTGSECSASNARKSKYYVKKVKELNYRKVTIERFNSGSDCSTCYPRKSKYYFQKRKEI